MKKAKRKKSTLGTKLVVLALVIVTGYVSVLGIKSILNSKTAADLCFSATDWEKYKENMNKYQCSNQNQADLILKNLPNVIEQMTTLSPILAYEISESDADTCYNAINHALQLYYQNNPLRFTVTKSEPNNGNISLYIAVQKQPLTHLGNAVELKGVPYYRNCEDCVKGINAWYYDEEEMAYATKIAYLTFDGELVVDPIERYSQSELETLLDDEKVEIDRNFDGQILIHLSTPTMLLGWTKIEYLYQYIDAKGNMEYGFSIYCLIKKSRS